jgi:hypothetical protein
MDFKGIVNVAKTADNQPTLTLNGDRGDLTLGGNGQEGAIALLNAVGQRRMSLESALNGARLQIRDSENQLAIDLVAALNAAVLALGGSGFDGNILLKNTTGKETIKLSGRDGDITLEGADAAENFEIVENATSVAAGTVMVIDPAGKLRTSFEAYDRRVAGVVSGAGDYRPGIILGGSHAHTGRLPIALVGKVFCKADASCAPIAVGDLLTSSNTPGHAMKALDPLKAFGAVIGKALLPLPSGQGLIPILVALQ